MFLYKRLIPGKAAFQNRYLRLGCVVLVFHAGGTGHFSFFQLFKNCRTDEDFLPQRRFQLFFGNIAGSQQHGMLPHQCDHRGFHPHAALSPIQNQGQTAIHVRQGILRVGGAGLAGQIGRGRSKSHAGGPDDLLHHRMGGHPHTHCIQSGTGHLADLAPLGQHHGQRPRPIGGSQLSGSFRHLRHNPLQHLHIGYVYDERVVLRAALGLKNFPDRLPVAGIGGNAVHCLSRQCHQFSGTQQFRGLLDALFIDRQNLCFHTDSFLFNFSSR